jgi:hypothetical protein
MPVQRHRCETIGKTSLADELFVSDLLQGGMCGEVAETLPRRWEDRPSLGNVMTNDGRVCALSPTNHAPSGAWPVGLLCGQHQQQGKGIPGG